MIVLWNDIRVYMEHLTATNKKASVKQSVNKRQNMKQKVITCPAISVAANSPRGICTCNCDGIKCTGSYNPDGSRIPIRRSLPYQGIARRQFKREEELMKANSDHLFDCECFFCKAKRQERKRVIG